MSTDQADAGFRAAREEPTGPRPDLHPPNKVRAIAQLRAERRLGPPALDEERRILRLGNFSTALLHQML